MESNNQNNKDNHFITITSNSSEKNEEQFTTVDGHILYPKLANSTNKIDNQKEDKENTKNLFDDIIYVDNSQKNTKNGRPSASHGSRLSQNKTQTKIFNSTSKTNPLRNAGSIIIGGHI